MAATVDELERLYRNRFGVLKGLAGSITREPDTAADVVQEPRDQHY
jgi:DNA-directed RNA polymerase specialized sigma24 family protein